MNLRIILADTCVVSDFYKADSRFFVRLVGTGIELGIVEPVVEDLSVVFPELGDAQSARKAGLRVCESQLHEYARLRIGTPLSKYDQLSLYAAQRLGYTLATNDKSLRRACIESGVPVLWGLETLLHLCREGAVAKSAAESIARSIHQTNPRWITKSILEDFLRQLR